MPTDMNNLNDDGPSMPAGLQRRFGSLYGTVDVPQRVDEAVLGEARRRFAKCAAGDTPQPIRAWWATPVFRIGVGLAAAAAVTLVIIIDQLPMGDHAAHAPRGLTEFSDAKDRADAAADIVNASAKGDINRDGKLNVLDAYTLQRRIDTAALLEAQWDLTEDGVVDQLDVNAVAAEAVKLPGGKS